MLAALLVSLLLFVLAGVLLDAHRQDWRRTVEGIAEGSADTASHRFARSRYVRRCFASGSIAVVGGLVAVWPITPREPFWVAVYTAVLILLAVAIFSLGIADACASSRRYHAETRRRLAEHTRALEELIKEHHADRNSPAEAEANPA